VKPGSSGSGWIAYHRRGFHRRQRLTQYKLRLVHT
jgi:hypothetical protein